MTEKLEKSVDLIFGVKIREKKTDRVLAPRYEIATDSFDNGDEIKMCAMMSGSIVFEFSDGGYCLIDVNELFQKVSDCREISKK